MQNQPQKENEMKIGEYKRFDEDCGIACVFNEVSNKKVIVIYADVFDSTIRHAGELGNVIGKGQDEKEAMIDAIKYLIRRERRFEQSLSENDHSNSNPINVLHKAIEFLESQCLTNADEVVLPIQAWTTNYQENKIEDIEGEFWNANIVVQEGKAFECTL
jgi:hypothetical protein